ncbi:MAG: DUF1214 domain-containing protein [Myxococcales bacterium]
MTATSSPSLEAFQQLLDVLRAASEKQTGSLPMEIDRAEGVRYLMHLLSGGIDLYLEGDPERPRFVPMTSEVRKFGGDNPDALYHFAPIRGDRSYRITGRKTKECYLSFTVHGRTDPKRLGMTAEPIQADINDRQLKVGPDGRFELVLSAHEQPGNWVKLEPSAASIITRHYYELERPAIGNPEVAPELKIEALDPAPVRPSATEETMARRIADVAAFVRGATLELIPMGAMPVPFVSKVPNELPTPSPFRAANQASWGAVDIVYAMAPFALRPDEALVMEGTLPECAFANVMLWNRHMQTLEFRDRKVSLNRAQMKLGEGGTYRIVIAHRDPGVPNWLDTEGHFAGMIFWRFLLPKALPAKTVCKVVPLTQLA